MKAVIISKGIPIGFFQNKLEAQEALIHVKEGYIKEVER